MRPIWDQHDDGPKHDAAFFIERRVKAHIAKAWMFGQRGASMQQQGMEGFDIGIGKPVAVLEQGGKAILRRAAFCEERGCLRDQFLAGAHNGRMADAHMVEQGIDFLAQCANKIHILTCERL